MKLDVPRMFKFASTMFDLFGQTTDQSQLGLAWQGQVQTDQPTFNTRIGLRDYFVRDRGCEAYRMDGPSDVLFRGNFTITQLPLERSVSWEELPIIVTATYTTAPAGTTTHLRIAASPDLLFDRTCAEFFQENAQREFTWAADRLKTGTAEQRKDQEIRADYEAFGLTIEAAWPDVKKAYRAASMQYHPDRFAGDEVPEHLVALAAERFSELTARYQRIKEHLTASASG